MEQNKLFTREQKLIFDQVTKSSFIKSNFYFTGGTALSYFYLQHRYSEDLDFFSEKKFETRDIETEISQWSSKYKFTYDFQIRQVVSVFTLSFSNGIKLKVDFGFYPYKRIEKGRKILEMPIDSLIDIAVNKLTAIKQRLQARDFVDLYYLLQQFTIWDLIEGARIKFRMEIEPWILAADFALAQDLTELPRMLKPLTLDQLKSFYRNLAKKLAKTVVE